MPDKKRSGGYIAPCAEWERPEPSPGGDPFSDPAEVDAVLEETRRSILNQARQEVSDA